MADRFVARPSGTPVLEIRGLNVFYGRSHALQGVDLTLRQGALAVVGRNGMGKTTLCNAIMGLVRASSGSIRFAGEELIGRAPADIARLGIGYVPQGRRLWRSLTVEEPLRIVDGERALSQREVDPLQRVRTAIQDIEVLDLQHRGAAGAGDEAVSHGRLRGKVPAPRRRTRSPRAGLP